MKQANRAHRHKKHSAGRKPTSAISSRRQFSLLALLVVMVLAGILGLRYIFRASAAAPPPAGGYYQLIPPNAQANTAVNLPSEATCAAEVLGRNNPWEPTPRPGFSSNTVANHTLHPNPSALGNDTDDYTAIWNSTYKPRITGNFQGTTDQIIQWAACKWGWSDDMIRAEAIQESNWEQAGTGDNEPRSNGHCPYDISGDPCPTSYGIMQTKWYFHPFGYPSNSPQSSYPWIRTSTAFELDQFGAMMRGCYDGMSTYLGNTKGDEWGCIGSWYSGDWHDPGANSYIASVQNYFTAKPWRNWADLSGTGNDTVAPNVSITAPTGGSVTGTVNITASATDNVGVVGVQFKIDGVNLGSEDSSTPYSMAWNTTTVSSGTHTITAVARDAAGNTRTSAAVTVTVGSINKAGDVNGDGIVGIADLSILATHYGQAGTRSQGDLSSDGFVGIADLSILATNWGT